MNKGKLNLFFAACVCFSAFIACSKKEETPDNTNTPNNQNPPVVSLEDTICRNWEVKSATHNGSNDPSSLGLKLTLNKNGTYLLHSTSYQGTWEFIEQKSKVLLDKNTANYKTTWTIVKLSSKKLEVTFKSPFTGGSAAWSMVPY